MKARAADLTKVLRLLGAFTVLSVLAGVLGAGVAIPAIGAMGSTAKGTVSMFNSLPDELGINPLNQQSVIKDKNGVVIATPYAENRIIVPLAKIAPIMRKAQIAIEDSRFYEHGAVDTRGLSRAVVETLSGNKQGASTLTQQYVKLTLQENARLEDDQAAVASATARSGWAGIARKLRELRYAMNLENTMTKDQILEAYLNLAYYGDLAYGVEAAAQHYFSIPASQLNYNQAALLAGTVQQPGTTDPHNNPKAAQARRDVVLDRMATLGVITPAQAAAGKKVAVTSMLKVKPSQNTCQRAPVSARYYCAYVMAWLKTQKGLGKDVAERLKNINTKGLTIQTSFDSKLSADIQKILTAKVPINDPSGVGAAATIIEPGTGRVIAMAQTSNYPDGKVKGDEVNWNVDKAYGGGPYGFQTGSTAKPFALVTAPESGIPVNGEVFAKRAGPGKNDGAEYFRSENAEKNCGNDFYPNPWSVRNDFWDGGKPITLKRATGESINTAFASLTFQLGICKVQATMTRLGLHTGGGQPIEKSPSVVLGTATLSPMTLANAYATFAADGKLCTPTPVDSITTPDRKAIAVDKPNCKQVISPDVARGVTKLLQEPFKPHGTAQDAAVHLAGGRPEAGKTGTTDNNVETWFVGFTPQLTTAVYVGTPNSERRMQNLRIGDQYYGHIFGATIAGPLWKQTMDRALQGEPVKDFKDPSSKIDKGDYVDIPGVVGMSYDQAKAALEQAGFSAFRAGSSNSSVPAGLVAGTTPNGQALRGSSVGLYISTGYVAPAPPPPPQPKPTKSTTSSPKPTITKPKPTKTRGR
jgi:membrane peptidoglycan carboxypeptidase